ncbi:MAG: hypothetical protein ACPGLW_04515, partial [Luminiphilus sp.]
MFAMMKKQVMKLTPTIRVRMSAIRSASILSAEAFPPALLPIYAITSSIQSSLIANERLCEILANQRGGASPARQVLAVFDVVFSMLAPSPIERSADCDTERDPNGLSGKNKGDRAHSCTRTYPVTNCASASRFFIHGMLRETSLNRDAFSKIARL